MSTSTQPRISISSDAREQYRAMIALDRANHAADIDPRLHELVKIRASQINGCAYCIDMHSKDARALGETEQRLYALDAWRETPFYTDKERAALAWTEAITMVSESHVPDEVFAEVKKHFSEKEIVDVTLVAGMINLWNRIAIPMRAVPGIYQPSHAAPASAQ